MSEGTSGDVHVSPAGQEQAAARPVLEPLDEAECLRLISPGGIGRLAFTGRYGLTVFPVNYKLHDGSIMFRTSRDSPTDEDLRTGIAHAEYEVAFEIDYIDAVTQVGWSVLVQGSAHHMASEAERAAVRESGVEPWAGGSHEHAIRITPSRVTGRRLRRPAAPSTT
jgi:nitroimidazol reductase NimA-like FMN-containing flavoprotein (pyridoxamine 5'-phosphate oxidase superfamily)